MKKLILLLALLPLALTAQAQTAKNGGSAPPPTKPQASSQTPTVHAKFGGSLKAWVDENVSFPVEAVEAGVTGVIDVSFIVRSDGSVAWVQPKSDPPNTFLFLELKRALLASPKWSPALNSKGEPVSSGYSFKYDFTPKLDSAARANMTVAKTVVAPHFGVDTTLAGGMARLGKYIDENYEVADYLKKKDYEYHITFGFTVGADGKVRDVTVKGCDNPTVEKSVIDLITGTKWSAAIINGQPRDYYMQAGMVLAGNKKGKIEDVSFIAQRGPLFQGKDPGVSFKGWIFKSLQNLNYESLGTLKAVLQVMVEKNGSISEPVILKTNSKPLADEVILSVKRSPADWTPAVQWGERVRLKYFVLLTFDVF